MPKIFLIKNRLHQQQLKLLESQNLIQKNDEEGSSLTDIIYNQECDGRGGVVSEPLSLVAKKQGLASGKWSYSDTDGSGCTSAAGKLIIKLTH